MWTKHLKPWILISETHYEFVRQLKDVFRDNHIDSSELGSKTKLNDKQAAAAVRVVHGF